MTRICTLNIKRENEKIADGYNKEYPEFNGQFPIYDKAPDGMDRPFREGLLIMRDYQ